MSPHRCKIAHGRIAMQANCLHLNFLRSPLHNSTTLSKPSLLLRCNQSVTALFSSALSLCVRVNAADRHGQLTSQTREKERLICSKTKLPSSPSTHSTTLLTKRAEPRITNRDPLPTAARCTLLTNTAHPSTPPNHFLIEFARFTQMTFLDSKR